MPAYRVPRGVKCNPGSLKRCNSFLTVKREVNLCRSIDGTDDSFALNTRRLGTRPIRSACASFRKLPPRLALGPDWTLVVIRQTFERSQPARSNVLTPCVRRHMTRSSDQLQLEPFALYRELAREMPVKGCFPV